MATAKAWLEKSNEMFHKIKERLNDETATTEQLNEVESMQELARGYKMRALKLSEIEKAALEPTDLLTQEIEGTGDVPFVETKGFKGWEDFIVAVAGSAKHNGMKYDPRLTFFKEQVDSGHETKQMVESVGASGGFLVPSEFIAQMQGEIAESSVVRRQGPTIIRMRRRQVNIPVLDQTGATANQGHWFGGLLGYWEEEAAEKTKSEPKFRQVSLVAHKLILYTRASDELLDDSAISLADFLSGPMGMAGATAWHEDWAFLRGTGAGQPLGIINAPATITEPRFGAGAIVFDDLADMMQDFLPSARGAWTITQTAMSGMIQLNGPAANPSYIWQPSAREGIPSMIMGMPVYWTEKLPTLGNAGDILLADMAYYLVGDRQATTVESTQFDYWRYDQTSWRCVHRVDGQPWLSAPWTLADGTSQISPFVIVGGAGAGS